MSAYPSTLPCPQIEGYQVDIDYGVSGVTFENGNRRQRRQFRQERHYFTFSLVLTTAQLWTWQSWANQFGYDWHYMNLESNYSGLAGQTLIPHYIRYISDISIEAVDIDYFRVSVQAEMDVDTLPIGVVEFTGDWLIANTPAAPATDRIIAGTPAAPATDFIIAGSPAAPAA